MKRKAKAMPKKLVAYMITTAMIAGTVSYAQPMNTKGAENQETGNQEADNQFIMFTPAPAGHVYAGMPLFDGIPEHYEQYLDAVIDYIGLEGAARFAFDTRGDYVLTQGENAGRTIPGSLSFTDCVQGVSTDFPAIIGLGQSWNKDLIESVGNVLGNERVNKVDYSSLSDINVMACTATSDLRINPLSGRFDEGFAEDPYLTATMVNEMATGVSGITEASNPEGFWQKAVVTTKHFTTYNAQTFRSVASNNASARTLLEYQPQSTFKGIESGAIGGFMSSYGRTNGVPNIISPLINYAKSLSPFGLFSVTDAGSVSNQSGYGNGFDPSYVPVIDDGAYNGAGYSSIGALMAVANSAGASTTRAKDASFLTLIDQVEAGTYGVTKSDVENVARDQIGQLVRCGVLNEDMNDYPFYAQSAGIGAADDYNNTYNQGVALEAAQESIVLLKNENDILPLDKDSAVYVSGPMSVARFKTTYAVGKSPEIENALYSSAAGIRKIGGEDKVNYSVDAEVVNIKTADGKYIALSDDGKSLVTVNEQDKAAKFEKYSWGQDGYSYKCLDNDKWLKGVTTGGGWGGGGTFTGVEASGTESLEQIVNDLEATYVTTAMPYRFRVEENPDQTISYIMESYSESFVGTTPVVGYYTNGRYLKVDGENIAFSELLQDQATAENLRTENVRFIEEVVKEAGADTKESASDYAVVVVGAPARHSSGEGCDRSDLYLGDDQYTQVANVAAAYPGRTIVVVQTNYPEIIEEIKQNDDVAAIITQPYAGQYGGYALGQVIYGDVAPTGKLTATWYSNNDVLPEITSYSIPEGLDLTLDELDPRFRTDMTNSDPVETGLTYMYTDDSNITYEFGAGITYTSFAYSNLQVPESINAEDGSFQISVDVTNTGDTASSEVVQAYISNNNSAYGDYAPKTKLASFAKVEIDPGQTKTVMLDIETKDFALWDTNSHSYVTESGNYDIMVGSSSKNILQQSQIAVVGAAIGELDAGSPVNVFDSSFAGSGVVYREVSKAHTAKALAEASRDSNENAASNVASGYYAVMSEQDGAWVAMKNVNLDEVTEICANVATRNEYAAIDVRSDAPDGELIASINFDITPVNSYTAPETGVNPDAAIDLPVNELAYEDVTIELEAPLQGTHDVYLVFANADARINTIQFVKEQEEEVSADKSVLSAIIEKVNLINADNYTAESFEKLTESVKKAEIIIEKEDAAQEEVDAAVMEIVTAVSSLAAKPAEADKVQYAEMNALNQAVAIAQAVVRSKYTAASLARLDCVLQVAQELSRSAPEKGLQSVVNVVAKSVNDAVGSLELEITSALPKKGLKVTIGKLKYKVTSSTSSKRTVTVTAPVKKSYTALTIPSTVKISGYTYNVTAIGDKAFRSSKKLKTLKIGSKVTTVGKQAFYNCSKLKKITVNTKGITKVGSNALKGIDKKAVLKVPASKLKKYKALFKNKGQKSTVTIKK